MAEDWDRRSEDRKARSEFTKQFKDLRGELRMGLDKLAERVNELDEFLRGGKSGQDPLGTRVHLMERAIAELQVLVKGDAMGRGSLKELAKEASKTANEALKIAEGKLEARTTRRGQNVSLWVAAFSLIGVITMATLSNWDKISKTVRGETPEQKLERIQKEIEEEKKTRGPQIQKKLREIERAARFRG